MNKPPITNLFIIAILLGVVLCVPSYYTYKQEKQNALYKNWDEFWGKITQVDVVGSSVSRSSTGHSTSSPIFHIQFYYLYKGKEYQKRIRTNGALITKGSKGMKIGEEIALKVNSQIPAEVYVEPYVIGRSQYFIGFSCALVLVGLIGLFVFKNKKNG